MTSIQGNIFSNINKNTEIYFFIIQFYVPTVWERSWNYDPHDMVILFQFPTVCAGNEKDDPHDTVILFQFPAVWRGGVIYDVKGIIIGSSHGHDNSEFN